MELSASKVAVVTGAASGIGRATALALADKGMQVAIADIDEAGLADTRATIERGGGTAIAVRTDVSSEPAIEALRDATLEAFGAVHFVHNNAGVVAAGPVEEITLDLWKWVLDVDLWSVIYGVRTFVPLMKQQGEGHVVNTASTAGLHADAGIGPYNVAKFGVVAVTETLRRELLRGSGVSCSVLCPGAVNTQIVQAERNLPPGVAAATGPIAEGFRAGAGVALANVGLAPGDVAKMVVEAVEQDRFWILTHPEWLDRMADRAEAMRAGDLRYEGMIER